MDWTPRTRPSPSGTIAPDLDIVKLWWDNVKLASSMAGLPIPHQEDTEELLEGAGFIDISQKKVHCNYAVFADLSDARQEVITKKLHGIVGGTDDAPEVYNSWVSMSMYLFSSQLKWPADMIQNFCMKVFHATFARHTTLYHDLYVCKAWLCRWLLC
jgi:hypothetical protein